MEFRTFTAQPFQLESLERRNFFSASASPDPVLEWNNVLIDALRADRTLPGPGWSSRNAAIMHAAIFDAVNAIDHSYESFLVDAKAAGNLPLTAAVAGAGWRVLSTIYPGQKATFDAALTKSLKRVRDGRLENKAVQLGIHVADTIIESRAGDGAADDTNVPYTPGTDPGDWQPTYPGYTPAWGPGWGDVTPFLLDSGDQFVPRPAPELDSAEYTAAFNEVKSLGEKNSATRTADETEIGIFWAYDRAGTGTPPALYNQLVQAIAKQQHNSTVQNARLFALANFAMADAGISAWDCKFLDNFWRPIDGIRKADIDGNPLTAADPAWEPLGAPGGGVVPDFTPPFPAYVSGHATFGAAVCEILKEFYHRDKIHFTLTSDELPGATRSFDSFTEAAEENGISRIYLGIHWQFDNTEGQKLGREIADYIYDNALTREKRDHNPHNFDGCVPKVKFLPHAATRLSVITLMEKNHDDLL